MFTNDRTYPSLGRRIFDVYIQGQKVLEDYNIAEKAGGAARPIIEQFNASVDGTLEIHFLWSGKGTHAIPHQSVYGPLISAISVTLTFKPKIGHEGSKLNVGAILGIVVASCIVLVLIIILLALCLRRKEPEDTDLRNIKLQSGHISFKHIKTATKNFDPTNKIGEGGFGPVYKGVLSDGSVIAVKQLSSKSKQGNREFINEISLISALEHPNLVKLYGCCIEGNQLFLIYEYMENNNLAIALFGLEGKQSRLDWETHCQIGLGIARGLTYLHEESRLKVVHRDIKATNILLDKDFNAKISYFGLAKLYDEENTHQHKNSWTRGYMAPEYATRGHLTYKADVYSFGIVLLEIVSGTSNTNPTLKEGNFTYLLDWALVLQEQGNLLEIVDPSLGTNYSKEEAINMLTLACTDPSPALRPTMSTVVSMLDADSTMELPSFQTKISEGETFSNEIMTNTSQSEIISMDDHPPWQAGALEPSSASSKEGSILILSTSRSTLYTE